jgi:hypothetical protein
MLEIGTRRSRSANGGRGSKNDISGRKLSCPGSGVKVQF